MAPVVPPLRVLHCIYDDPGNPWVAGGGAVRLAELYRRLADRVNATILTGNYPGARDTDSSGVRRRHVGSPAPYAWSRWTYARAATRLLAAGDFDAAVFDYSAYTPLRLPERSHVAITVHHLTGPTARQRWGPVLGGLVAHRERQTIRKARWISATSAATEAEVRRIATPGTQIFRVGAGVPDELFRLQRREAGYLLYFGRLDWFQKGLDTLLDAAAVLFRERTGVELRIAGRGKDAERVQTRAAALGIADRVRMLGAVSDAERMRLLAGAAVVLMPSRFEGFGMVAAEAMAAGAPLVAAATGSLPEVVAPPEGGVLVPAGNATALASEVGELLDDPERRSALGRSARRSAERFRWAAVADDHLRFLHQIAAA